VNIKFLVSWSMVDYDQLFSSFRIIVRNPFFIVSEFAEVD